jgi:hypothetical protein
MAVQLSALEVYAMANRIVKIGKEQIFLLLLRIVRFLPDGNHLINREVYAI